MFELGDPRVPLGDAHRVIRRPVIIPAELSATFLLVSVEAIG
ncbi:hypothetical protein [Nonomuraea sp. PA05]|nr:hypothetical protein [Nonomuraea sp. PA05]